MGKIMEYLKCQHEEVFQTAFFFKLWVLTH